MGGLKPHVQFRATHRHRLTDYVTQMRAHTQKALYIWTKANECCLYLQGHSANMSRHFLFLRGEEDDLLSRSVTPRFNYSSGARTAATASQRHTAGKYPSAV